MLVGRCGVACGGGQVNKREGESIYSTLGKSLSMLGCDFLVIWLFGVTHSSRNNPFAYAPVSKPNKFTGSPSWILRDCYFSLLSVPNQRGWGIDVCSCLPRTVYIIEVFFFPFHTMNMNSHKY